jgi:hypothetical protein
VRSNRQGPPRQHQEAACLLLLLLLLQEVAACRALASVRAYGHLLVLLLVHQAPAAHLRVLLLLHGLRVHLGPYHAAGAAARAGAGQRQLPPLLHVLLPLLLVAAS